MSSTHGPADAGTRAAPNVFEYRSVIPASAADVFAWHERPDALTDLLPRTRLVRIDRRSGGIRTGGEVSLSIGIGPLRMRWDARHFDYVRGTRFCDEQVRGPFATWRHTHTVYPMASELTLYEDRVEYALPGGRLVNRLVAPLLRVLLNHAFATRHQTVRSSLALRRDAEKRLSALHSVMVCCLLVLGPPAAAGAQDTSGSAVLRGHVANAAGADMAGAAVCASGTSQCDVTDDQGVFTLRLRAGSYTLDVLAPGQPPVLTDPVDVRGGFDNAIEVVLPELTGVQQTVTVTAPALSPPQAVTTSTFVVPAAAVATGAGALQDVARYVQALPGVVIGTDDFRNDLIVRGGSPLENLYIVDNIELPNINSFASFASAGGTVSMVDVQLVEHVTFRTGGFPAPYGSRTSSVLQITGREGRRDRVRGRATVGFAGAGGVAEGPIGRGGRGSWIASARRSFLDLFTADTGIGGVPVLYTVNGKAVYDLSSRDRVWGVNVSGLDTARLGLTDTSDLSDELSNLDINYRGWRSASGVNWQRVYSRGVGLFGVTYSQAAVNQQVLDLLRNGLPPPDQPAEEQIANGALVFRENSGETDTTVKYDHTTLLSRLGTVQAGASIRWSRVDYDTDSPVGNESPFFAVPDANPFRLRTALSTYEGGGYAQLTRNLGRRLQVTAGARVDRFSFISASRVSPRVDGAFTLARAVTLRGAYGQYYQQPFFLFLMAYPENRSLEPFRADHVVGGVNVARGPAATFTIEAYRKTYSDYPVSTQIGPLSLANVGDTFAVRDVLFPMTSTGRGVAYGVEFSTGWEPDNGRLNGVANLALSRARHAGRDEVLRAASFDYPVVANVNGAYELTSRWRLALKATYLGGRPITPVDVQRSREQRRLVYDLGRVNDERGPAYFRLDLRLDRRLRADRQASVFVGAQNVTNRRNFAGYSWDRRYNMLKPLEQLGIFPILGFEWPF